MANSTLEPVDYPKVVIDGLPYLLKWGTGALLRMERLGLPADKMREAFTYEKNPDGSEKVVTTRLPLTVLYTYLAAAAGTPLRGGRWKPINMSPEEIADCSSPEEVTAFTEAVVQMLVKVKPEGTNPATAPAIQPEPLQ